MMEFSPVLDFLVGLISSIGYYRLFFSINRPTVRWRFIVMLIVVIISRPICSAWQLQFATAQGYKLFPIFSLYFFTRLIPKTKPISANEKESENTAYKAHTEYAQFIGQLSKRELEVISAVLAGSLRYKTLASSLNISVNTVKTHLQHIYQITGANNIESLSALFSGYSPTRSETTLQSP